MKTKLKNQTKKQGEAFEDAWNFKTQSEHLTISTAQQSVISAFICTELKDALTDVGNTVHPYFEKHKLFRAAKFEAKKKKKL